MNRFFNQDKSFFCNGQKVSELVEFVNIFKTFGDWCWVYTDVEVDTRNISVNTSCNPQKVSELGESEHFPHINSLHSLWTVTKNDWSSLNHLFMAKFQLMRMSTYAKNKLQMCAVTQHQCRRPNVWKMFTNSPSSLTFCGLQKMTCPDWTI